MIVIPIVFETVGASNRRASWDLTVQSIVQYVLRINEIKDSRDRPDFEDS